MATAALNWYIYAIFKTTGSDAGTSNPDPYGFFYCRANVARYFDIVGKRFTGEISRTRKAHSRSKTLADGTVLGGTDTQVKESTIVLTPAAVPRGKPVVLTTGKVQGGKSKNLTFNFPKWASSSDIADALGTLIPPGKLDATNPSATECYPYARLPSGKRIWIIEQSAAIADTVITVPTVDEASALLASKVTGGKSRKVAG